VVLGTFDYGVYQWFTYINAGLFWEHRLELMGGTGTGTLAGGSDVEVWSNCERNQNECFVDAERGDPGYTTYNLGPKSEKSHRWIEQDARLEHLTGPYPFVHDLSPTLGVAFHFTPGFFLPEIWDWSNYGGDIRGRCDTRLTKAGNLSYGCVDQNWVPTAVFDLGRTRAFPMSPTTSMRPRNPWLTTGDAPGGGAAR
jgi:hypothetical protein